METHFASPERAKDDKLTTEIDAVSHHPVVDSMMHVVIGLFAVLNEHRQIVAVNDTFLQHLGIGDAAEVFGLRPGEALDCTYANRMAGGCGTSEFCASCNAAIAIVTCLAEDTVVSKNCSVAVDKDGVKDDLYLRVSAYPTRIEDSRFLLLFLQDITHQQRWASLERAFFHDINNIVLSLLGSSELLEEDEANGKSNHAHTIRKLSLRLAKEVAMQNCLAQGEMGSYQPIVHPVAVNRILSELGEVISQHPSRKSKQLEIADCNTDSWISSDFTLLMRVLTNLAINALEATDEGETAKVWVEQTDREFIFHVWNRRPIAGDVQKRIFQRNFSTKKEEGRGIGTFVVKLFSEKYLGGTVDFSSNEEDGTVFSVHLPA